MDRLSMILAICDASRTAPSGGHGLPLDQLADLLRGESEAADPIDQPNPAVVAGWAYALRDVQEVREAVRWYFNEAAPTYGIRPQDPDKCDRRNRLDWLAVREILEEE
jgi:hypothetical protein